MKLECSVEKIKNAIVNAARVTSKNLTLPALQSILLVASGKSLKIRATNLNLGIEIEIPAKIEKEGVALIKADVIGNFFSSINPKEQTTLSLENDNLLITTKNSKTIVKNYPHDDFPTIPRVSGEVISIPSKKFIEGFKNVYYAASISEGKPEIASIYIYPEDDMFVFVATDSFRLAEKKVKIKTQSPIPTIIIPIKNATEILRVFDGEDEEMRIEMTKNQIAFSLGSTYITSRLIDGTFPDYKQIMPKTQTTDVVVLKQDLLGVLKTSNIFSDKFNQITLVVKPKEKLLAFKAKNTDVGESTSTLAGALSGENIEVSLNYKYLLDCLQVIPQDSISIGFSGNNKAIIIRGVSDNSFTYLVMPMNR